MQSNIAYFAAWALVACQPALADSRGPFHGNVQKTAEAVEAILADTPDCDLCATHPNCEFIDIESDVADFTWPVDSRQRVLVVDTNLEAASMGKYRNRVSGRLELDAAGEYHESPAVIRVQRGFAKILDILNAPETGYLSATELSEHPTFRRAQQHFPGSIAPYSLSHGGSIFATVAELSPGATFVLADLIEPPKDVLCRRDWDALRVIFANAGTSLRQEVIGRGVDFINLSASFANERFVDAWPEQCPEQDELTASDVEQVRDMYRHFYRSLADIPGVTLVSAASHLHRTRVADKTNTTDCNKSDYPNRTHVAMLYLPEASIGVYGEPLAGYINDIPAVWKPVSQCVDAFVNSGLSLRFDGPEGKHPVHMVSWTGLSSHPFTNWVAGASDVTPVFLSRLIHLRMTDLASLPSDLNLPGRLRDAATASGGRPVQDPLANGTFEKDRLFPREPKQSSESELSAASAHCDAPGVQCDLREGMVSKVTYTRDAIAPMGMGVEHAKDVDGNWHIDASPWVLPGCVLTSSQWTIPGHPHVNARLFYKAIWQGHLNGNDPTETSKIPIFNLMATYETPEGEQKWAGRTVHVADLGYLHQISLPREGQPAGYLATTGSYFVPLDMMGIAEGSGAVRNLSVRVCGVADGVNLDVQKIQIQIL